MKIEQLNERFAQADLGRNVHGQPRFAWKWSEDLMHPMRVIDSYGTPQFDGYEPVPGSSLVAPKPMFVTRKLCPELKNQWVLCEWKDATISEDEWRRMFGYRLEWPRHGSYKPVALVGDTGEQYVCLPPHRFPSRENTDHAIRCIKAALSLSVAEQQQSAVDAAVKREREQDRIEDDMISDDMLPFCHVPGTKDHVSFPTVKQ
jgi:hypothetical protein